MKLIPRPLSFSAYQAWQKNVNQYLLYRLGYVSRTPALHRGIDIHKQVADALMDRSLPDEQIAELVGYVKSHYDVLGVEVSMQIEDPPMRGIADMILKDDGVMIADLKTGRDYPYHEDQLHWYFTIFRHLPISGGLLFYLDLKRDNLSVKEVEIDEDKLAEIRDAVSQAHFELSRQNIPEELVIPVHGVTFVDRSGFDEIEGPVIIQKEWVETEDRGTVWGLRVLYQGEPIGWLPDSLKHRIHADKAMIFAARGDTERKFGYVRIHVLTSEIDWDGIAA